MKAYLYTLLILLFFLVICPNDLSAQKAIAKDKDGIYVDDKGILRWKSNKKEASFFGVNYSTPFAFAYRAHQTLGVDIEEAIRQDVYHMARLGFDAFRVHVWDTEISDMEGNLLENEHLRLFDFLLAELKKRNIKTIITPIAFWGNGYPEPDEDTPGFSRYYGRGRLTTDESAITAQENYLKQFFEHVNPYTKMTYQEDHDVVAVEINNEPAHSGPKEGVTEYINRLKLAITSTGFSKPIFYNISQGPSFADAVAKSEVDGFSFQWYPSGLVSGNTLQENYLPHVNQYTIPFDTIPEFHNKPLMVYEFDAADILEPYIYPAMARSFRQAGFQWATQFAYDPLAIAHNNTEYQTHYLNLAYTPAKAISMMIAAKAFRELPLKKNYGSYPDNDQFGPFRVSYEQSLGEMVTEEEFYYSNHTDTKAKKPEKLKRVAGVGNSQIVEYEGYGAYFLDKIEKGVWRLEVMPDAIHIRDPFARTSPERSVTRIVWEQHSMKINLDQLGTEFNIVPLNKGNNWNQEAKGNQFEIQPGTYLLVQKGKKYSVSDQMLGNIGLREFVAPESLNSSISVFHKEIKEVTSGVPLQIQAKIVGLKEGQVKLQYNHWGGRFTEIPMEALSKYDFTAQIPAKDIVPGELNYRIVVEQEGLATIFPGKELMASLNWSTDPPKTWKVFIANKEGRLEIFNAGENQKMQIYPTYQEGFSTRLVAGDKSREIRLQLRVDKPDEIGLMGVQYPIKTKLEGMNMTSGFTKMVLIAKVIGTDSLPIKIGLTDSSGSAMTAIAHLDSEFREITVLVSELSGDFALLLPRPYPGFMPLSIPLASKPRFLDWDKVEKIQLTFGSEITGEETGKDYQIEIGSIWLAH